jgi:hypothetical protein
MATENHLTIRDYFDRVLTGKQKTRKVISPSHRSEDASGTGIFYRMLATRQMQGVGNTGVKSTGLTIVDYLANPLRVERSSEFLPSAAKAKGTIGQQDHTQAKAPPGKKAESPSAVSKPLASMRRSTVIPSAGKSDSKHQKIEKSIQQAAIKYNLPPALIKGVIRAESNFQVDAVSGAGAQGLMQLMPATAKELGVTKPLDIDQNIDGGSRYLRKMIDSFDGDVKLALAAYNAGPGTVRKYDGEVPYPETIQYVDRVMRFMSS